MSKNVGDQKNKTPYFKENVTKRKEYMSSEK